jgi:hypothetical protein
MKNPLLQMAALLPAFAAALLSTAATAHIGPLDPGFGDAGMRKYGFQTINGGFHDRAVVGCAGADGTFTATGIASGDNRIVTMRLLPNGDYDNSYGAGGRVSVTLAGEYNDVVPGLCQPDGHMVMARTGTDASGNQYLQILRVLKHTGQLDSGFGSGGIVSVDLDGFIARGSDEHELALGLNALPNGDIAVSGQLRDGGDRGFVLLLSGAGAVRAVRELDPTVSLNATTVVEAPDGRLWVFGKNAAQDGAYRLTLSRQTLQQEDVLQIAFDRFAEVEIGPGRLVDAETVVLAGVARYFLRGVNAEPMLFVFRTGGASIIPMPQATLEGNPMQISTAPGRQLVTVLPGRRVLMSASARRLDGSVDDGIYLGLAHIPRRARNEGVEYGFGAEAARQAAFRLSAPGCGGVTPAHRVARLTLWRDMPVLVGSVSADCGSDAGGEDYLVSRIRPDYLFADGLD